MPNSFATPSTWINSAPAAGKLAFVIGGSLLLAASSWISVPMIPVPMTMQTFALLLIGAFYGSRLAFATVAAYLLEGALGLPVFAGGAAGAQHFIGPTGGYLIGFPFAAAFVGWCFEHGFARNFYAAFGAMLIGHLIVFVPGVAWLAKFVGLNAAIATGFTPFVLGTVVKCALAIAALQLWQQSKRGKSTPQ